MHTTLREICTREAGGKLVFKEHDAVEAAFGRGFGDGAHMMSFRLLLCVGVWVTTGERLGVKKADAEG